MESLSCRVAGATTAARQHVGILAFALLLASAGTAGCTGDKDDDAAPSRARCVQLRDHLVDLRIGDVTVDVDAHRDILRRSLGEEFLTTCAGMPPAEVSCALAAQESADVMRCRSVAAR